MENFTYKTYTELELMDVSVATLAWIGDAYFSLCAREWEVRFSKAKPVKLNKNVIGKVNAKAQADFLAQILPTLSEKETNIVRRAKNSPITTKSKNYSLAEYKHATAFEALLGWLYLLGNRARLNSIMKMIFGEGK